MPKQFDPLKNIYLVKKNQSIYKYAHRVIMEQYLGRELFLNELVHHKNGNRRDNRIENLEIISRAAHASLHHKGKKKSKEQREKMSKSMKIIHFKKTKNEKKEWRKKIKEGIKKNFPNGRPSPNKGNTRGVCSLEGCNKKYEARGFCKYHYEIRRRRGEFKLKPLKYGLIKNAVVRLVK